MYVDSDWYVTSTVRSEMSRPNALHAEPASVSCAVRPISDSYSDLKVYPKPMVSAKSQDTVV